MPAFEGQVRKRPLAVQNEGASNAFITCSFESQTNANVVAVYVSATDGVVHEVSCTEVSGTTTGGNQDLTKTVAVASTGAQSVLLWNGLDFGGAPKLPSVYFSISCNLVPGVGINNSYVTFPEDVGM